MTDSTRQFATGEPCWAEVTLPDTGAGERFYGGLLGWTFETAHTIGGQARASGREGPVLALLHGRRAATLRPGTGAGSLASGAPGASVGGLQGAGASGGGRTGAWRLHLRTADAAATLTRVREAGGRVLADAVELPGEGVHALVADPSGADFGVWEPRGSTGFAAFDEPGAYVWGEVLVGEEDREAVDTFYARVFGFGTYAADFGAGSPVEGVDFAVWVPPDAPSGDARAIGGRGTLDMTTALETPPHFLTYFSVTDCEAAVDTALRLGGRVLSGPMDTAYGRHAVLADDQGAEFAVMTRR